MICCHGNLSVVLLHPYPFLWFGLWVIGISHPFPTIFHLCFWQSVLLVDETRVFVNGMEVQNLYHWMILYSVGFTSTYELISYHHKA